MSQLDQLEADVRFVRQAMERHGQPRPPASVNQLWALAVFVGFALVDVRHEWVPLYWAVVGPAGFAASAYLGRRYAVSQGWLTPGVGRKHLWHWGATLLAVALAVAMPAVGLMPWSGLNAVILLVLAVSYYMAGVHLDRPLIWVGVTLSAGYVVVLFGAPYGWTLVGLAVAVSLLIAGRRGTPSDEAAS